MMKELYQEVLRREGRVVLMRTDGDNPPTPEEWERAAKHTRNVIAALLPDCSLDCPASQQAIRELADRLYLDYLENC